MVRKIHNTQVIAHLEMRVPYSTDYTIQNIGRLRGAFTTIARRLFPKSGFLMKSNGIKTYAGKKYIEYSVSCDEKYVEKIKDFLESLENLCDIPEELK